jgi:hypothetical protein
MPEQHLSFYNHIVGTMPPTDYGRAENGRRRVANRRGGLDAWLDAAIYYGLGQHLLLALPALWIVFQATRTPVAVSTSAIVALSAACLTIAAFRLGRLSVGAPWHRVEDNELGLGPDAGYGFLARRAAYLNATLGLATFLGAAADAGGAGVVGSIVVAGGIALGAILALPKLRNARDSRSVVVRGGYYAVALSVMAFYGQVLDLSVGAPTAVFAFGLVCLYVAIDVGADLRRLV